MEFLNKLIVSTFLLFFFFNRRKFFKTIAVANMYRSILLLAVICFFCFSMSTKVCNNTNKKLAQLVDDELDSKMYPLDIVNFRNTIKLPNITIDLINCSKTITLEKIIEEQLLMFYIDYNLKRFYLSFLIFITFPFQQKSIITNEDVLILINSFSTTNIEVSLATNLYKFYVKNNGWYKQLQNKKFTFDKYNNPRILLLKMTCSLLQNFDCKHEKWAYLFLVAIGYYCTEHKTNEEIKWPVDYSENHLDIANVFVLNIIVDPARMTKILPAPSSVGVQQISTQQSTLDLKSTMVDNIAIYNSSKLLTKLLGTKHPTDVSTSTTSTILTDNVYIKQPNFWKQFTAVPNIPEIVEIVNGPCNKTQRVTVKVNVPSLFTAFDNKVSNNSLELLRKLLPTVHNFPVEEYNARGQLLRDLIPYISKRLVDETSKKILDEVLYHVLLDGAGALPLKFKLHCDDVNATVTQWFTRRRRNYLVDFFN